MAARPGDGAARGRAGMHAGLVDNDGLAAAPDQDAGMTAGWINTMRVAAEAIAASPIDWLLRSLGYG